MLILSHKMRGRHRARFQRGPDLAALRALAADPVEHFSSARFGKLSPSKVSIPQLTLIG